jgi:predicted ATPase
MTSWQLPSSSIGCVSTRADDPGSYPHALPVVAWLRDHDGLQLAAGATFIVGENGTGKRHYQH